MEIAQARNRKKTNIEVKSSVARGWNATKRRMHKRETCDL